ncbi:hypothetical protein K461DRAFT_314655 [Myriangium duriaei CBS 260.36]|uniref:Uncharacterized protein n=1 Tax=Myriangium duriaei CBS 260.36 TaxID=1168546 RepID=A0A9P4IZU5_9PEZI|nr:hypothetical protein K461DRAFT_314655 [Myriangium duriaei CBS 260.36]
MLAFSQLLCVATLALGVLASNPHKHHHARIQVFTGTGCESVKHYRSHEIKENICRSKEPERNFLSYIVFHDDWKKDQQAWERNPHCHVNVFEDDHCGGRTIASKQLPDSFGECQNATFSHGGHGIRGSISYKLVCDKPVKDAPPRPVPVPAPTTVTQSTPTTPIPTSTVTMPAAPISSSPGSRAPSFITVTVPRSSSSVDITHTVYAKTVTSTRSQPAVTVDDTTTVWVKEGHSSSSHKFHTDTFVVTNSDRAHVKRDFTYTTESSAATSADTNPDVVTKSNYEAKESPAATSAVVTPDMVIRSDPHPIDSYVSALISDYSEFFASHSTEFPAAASTAVTPDRAIRSDPEYTQCYVSVDHHWAVSTCEVPKSTSS